MRRPASAGPARTAGPARAASAGPARTRRVAAIRLHPRSLAAIVLVSVVGVAGFGWPLLVDPGSGVAHSADAPYLFAALLPLLLAVVLAEVAEGGLDAKAVALLGVLSAVGAALRPLGGGTAGFEPMFFLLVLGGRALGPGFGFVLGSVTMFASALLTGGVGPWLPFQMMAASWVALGAGLLPDLRGRAEVWLLASYGAVAGLAYGLALNLSFWPFAVGTGTEVSYVAGDAVAENLRRLVAFTLASSLGFDVPRAALTALLVLVTGRHVLAALRRVARRAAFDVPVTFTAPAVIPVSTGSRTAGDAPGTQPGGLARPRPPGPPR